MLGGIAFGATVSLGALLAAVAVIGTVAAFTLQAAAALSQQPAPPKVNMEEPAQKEERRSTLEDPLARLARIDRVVLAWATIQS